MCIDDCIFCCRDLYCRCCVIINAHGAYQSRHAGVAGGGVIPAAAIAFGCPHMLLPFMQPVQHCTTKTNKDPA